jgi:2-oxoglutarate/2-oxoacid ferredoxin oxidoreductase subunit beta
MKPEDLITKCNPTWCPGCGNYAIWGAFKNAALQKGWDNTNSALVAGIGCHGNFVNFTKITSFEGLHGRALPVATGIKLANHKLNVFVFSGDGDCLGEGGNHLTHTARRNHDLTLIVHNNGLYGLTTGQTSPASKHGFKTKSTPFGNPDYPVFPTTVAIAAGATFVARSLATDISKLTELIIKANDHKGFSVIDVLQPCVTFNKEVNHVFLRENIYELKDHDITSKEEAFRRSLEWGLKQIPVGVFYQAEKESYESSLPQLKEDILIKHDNIRTNLDDLFKKFI